MKHSCHCVFALIAATWRRQPAGCFLALAMLTMVCSPVAGQEMSPNLVVAEVVPTVAAEVYPQPFSVFFAGVSDDPAQDILATVPTDTNDDGMIDNALASIPKGGGTVGVVDWVLVQLRLVPQGVSASVPDDACRNDPACRDNVVVVTKAALLMTDGTISSADADNLADGVLVFDGAEVDFDPDTQDMYIAINHRNHLPVLSGKVDVATSEGDYEYNFTDPAAAFTPETGAGILGGVVRQSQSQNVLVVAGGDANTDSNVGLSDLLAASLANNEGLGGYVQEDVDLTANMGLSDLLLVNRNSNLGVSRGIDF